MSELCVHDKCGRSIRGRPIVDWWRVIVARTPVWCCSLECATSLADEGTEPVQAGRRGNTRNYHEELHTHCGQPGARGFRAPESWIGTVTRDGRINVCKVWYCSLACLARSRGEQLPSRDTVPGRLADLNRLAGTCLTIMDATPARVEIALDRAFERLLADVEKQAKDDAVGRPSRSLLIAEALGREVQTAVCTKCGVAKPVDEFSAVVVERDTGWCLECGRDQKHEDRTTNGRPSRAKPADGEGDAPPTDAVDRPTVDLEARDVF